MNYKTRLVPRQIIGGASRPYHTGPYIQSGGGIFSWLGNIGQRYVFPFFSKAAKVASSGISDIAKSDATKNIIKKAKKAAVKGVVDTSNKILQGASPKEALKSSAKQAKKRIVDSISTEIKKAGSPASKKRKKEPTINKAIKAPKSPIKKKNRAKIAVTSSASNNKTKNKNKPIKKAAGSRSLLS